MRLNAYAIVASVLAATSASLGEFAIFEICPEQPGAQLAPSVDGSVVFWHEHSLAGAQVFGKDLATGEIFTVGGGVPNQLRPSVSGDLVAWSSSAVGQSGIRATNFRTAQEWPVCPTGRAPAVSGDVIVWDDVRNSPSGLPPELSNLDIYGLDMQTGQEFPICTALSDQTYPDISGNVVVWTDHRRVPPGSAIRPDVYGYDLAAGHEFLIAEHGDAPAISGDLVVWVGGGDIWGKRLTDGSPFPIHVGPNGQTKPDVDGRWVVWTHPASSTDMDIYGYDLLTGREFPIYVGPGRQDSAAVSGDLVVWTTVVGDRDRLFGAYIPEPASGALLLLACLPLLRRRAAQGPQ